MSFARVPHGRMSLPFLKMRSKKQAKNVNILPANEITSGKQLSAPDCSNSSSKQTEAVNRQKRWRI